MISKKAHNPLRELLISPLAIAVLIFLLFILGKSVLAILEKQREVRTEERRTEERYISLQEQEKTLQSSLAKLETSEGIETEFHNKFFVVKPGEQIIVVTDYVPGPQDTTDSDNGSWWSKIRGFFRR